ncbi:Na/Pi cotransporter family protein [Faecalibaculum rodentium]|uniref:PhoU domain-containing protein n=4 Tax=Faecalibaculum rodentium TaxID=1702221 RepID=A0A140DWY3_9FIRM|nr:Na/Pi cotransporter family protein [Faecalibaculum rodentium]AMK55160.1 hypothetical protein AALO17_20260 [Faecalibaculum rodentium]
MEIMKSILAFAGGLGMFIYGMHLLAEGLQQAAGSRARKLMAFLTGNRLAAVFTGAAVTALIQSSSAATVMVVGFVNASVMTLQQAVGVIMGANIGTTMTGWIVSMGEWSAFLKPSMIAPAFLFAGTVCLLTAKKEQLKHVAHILIGFGILFMGLDSMSGAIAPYTDEPVFADAFRLLGSNPIYGLLTGAVVTAIIQSSSASMGILQTLAMAGVVNWGAAAFIALGQNIGTCATALLSCIGTDRNARRAAVIHLLFNVIGSVVIGLCLWVFFLFNPAIAQSNVTGTELAVFHTSFNVLCTIMLFPFAGWLVKLSGQLVPAAGKTKKGAFVRLDPRMGEAPALALEAIESQIYAMSKIAQEAVKESAESPEKVLEDRQKSVEEMRQDITEALQGLNTSVMSQGEHQRSERDMMSLTDISRIMELSVQVAAIRGKADGDCESCQEGLKKLARSAARTLKLARHERVDEALEQEEAVDALEKELRQQVLDQMDAGTMKASHAVACLDCIRRYERISDHAEMLARNHEIQ